MSELTDKELKNLKPRAKLYKVTDRDGMYAAVTPTGVVSFRYQYRVNGRQEVLTIGRYSAEAARKVPLLWPLIFELDCEIRFAHRSFRWSNLASHNAGVTVVIVGIGRVVAGTKTLFEEADDGTLSQRIGTSISPYLTIGLPIFVGKTRKPVSDLSEMEFGNKPSDGGHLLLRRDEIKSLDMTPDQEIRFLRRIYGSEEFINGGEKYCIWIEDDDLSDALRLPSLATRIENVRQVRLASPDKGANALARRASAKAYANWAQKYYRSTSGIVGASSIFASRPNSGKHNYQQSKLRDLRRTVVELGDYRIAHPLGVD